MNRGSERWYDSWSRYLALVTVGITLVSTTIAFFTIGRDLGGVGELVTTCIGLTGLVVALQLEILFRVAERAQTRDDVGRLLEMVEDYPNLLPIVHSAFAASVSTLRRSTVEPFRREVLTTLNHANVRLQELSQGRLRIDDGDNTLTLERAASTQELLQGTTDEGDTSWWLHNSGALFFALNETLIKERNVVIERVWILAKQPDQATTEVIEMHHGIGVKIYLLQAGQKHLDRKLLVNMTMMDRSFLHEDLPNKHGQAVEYLFSENPADLERAQTRFAQLKSHSLEYKDRSSLESLFAGP
jgi:hypothetical protein